MGKGLYSFLGLGLPSKVSGGTAFCAVRCTVKLGRVTQNISVQLGDPMPIESQTFRRERRAGRVCVGEESRADAYNRLEDRGLRVP